MAKQTSKRGRGGSKSAAQVKTVNDNPKSFKCEFAGCTFATAYQSSLKRHLQKHESDPKVRCPFPCHYERCSYRAGQKSNLKSHIQSMHDENNPKPMVVCPLCPAEFHDKQACTDHLIEKHLNGTAITCSKCDFKSFFLQHFRSHFETEHGEEIRMDDDDIWGNSLQIWQCNYCHFIAKSEKEALEHSTAHPN